MVFFVLSRILGLLRDVIIAAQFGTSLDLEAYLAAFKVPDLLFNVMAGGALGSAFIPIYTRYLSQDDEVGAWRLASAVINWLLLLTISLSLLAAIFAPALTELLVPGFSPLQKALTASLMRWLLVSTVVFGLSGLLMGLLNAHQHFLAPALAPVIYNVAIIGGALFLSELLGVYGLALGIIIGAIGHLLVQLPALHRYGLRYIPTLALTDSGVLEVMRLMGPRMLGLAAIQLNFMWDAYLASGLAQGSYAGLEYGRRLMLLPQGIIAQSIASAAFPTFSTLAAKEDWQTLQETLTKSLRSVLYLTVPAALGLMTLATPIVQVFFERQAFNQDDTRLVVWALWFYTPGLIAHSVVEVLVRVFYALHNTKTPVFIGICSMGLNIVLSLTCLALFSGLGLAAYGGIAFASSIAIGVEMVWLMLKLPAQLGSLSLVNLWQPLKQIIFAGMIMSAILWGFVWLTSSITSWLVTPGGIILGCLIYGGLTLVWGLQEPVFVLTQVRRVLRSVIIPIER